MTPDDLPEDGAVLVVTDRPAEWSAVVADRNAAGHRTALLVVRDSDVDPEPLAEAFAAGVFAGAPWRLLEARAGGHA